MKRNNKTTAGLTAAAGLLLLSLLLPALSDSTMTSAESATLGLLLAFLVILITEALPVVVLCLLTLGLMPVLPVSSSLGDALSGFSNPVVFFILASFGIASAFEEVPLSRRILKKLLLLWGRDIRTILLAMMISAALVSSIVSNVPTCAIFMVIALQLLDVYPDEPSRNATGRAFMIGIPVASMIGGIMTPAGSSINLLAIGLLEQFTGATVSFVQWMIVGIPLAALILPVAWLLIVRIHKPAEIAPEQIRKFVREIEVPDSVSFTERKVIVIVSVMLVLWILSSWIPSINVMVVSLLGCALFFFPGIEVLEIRNFLRNMSWDAFFLVATVLSLGNAMIDNGVSERIAGLMPEIRVGVVGLVAFTAALIFLLLIVVPVAPSLVTIMTAPLVALASGAGVTPAFLMITCAVCACNCYLLPLDTVPLLTYSKGYYRMTDMMKSSLPTQIWIVASVTLWLPVAGKLTGMI